MMRAQLALVLAGTLLGSACVKNYPPPLDQTTSDTPTTTPTPVPVTHTIEFRVLGTVPLADITYGSAQDGTTTTETTIPWSASFKTARPSLFVYLKAQSAFNGTISAQIFVDGQLFREASNNFLGSVNVADASGQISF